MSRFVKTRKVFENLNIYMQEQTGNPWRTSYPFIISYQGKPAMLVLGITNAICSDQSQEKWLILDLAGGNVIATKPCTKEFLQPPQTMLHAGGLDILDFDIMCIECDKIRSSFLSPGMELWQEYETYERAALRLIPKEYIPGCLRYQRPTPPAKK